MAYLSLFLTAFIAATLLPSSSELVLSALVIKEQYSIALLWLSATAGNVIGSCLNYWLGAQLLRFQDKKWFPVSSMALTKAQQQFNRYGVYSLLFAWLPIIGDPLTFVGGICRVRFSLFLLLVTLGKGVRYLFVIAFAIGIEKMF